MWKRRAVKDVGRDRYKMNYWPCVLVGALSAIVTGEISTTVVKWNTDTFQHPLNHLGQWFAGSPTIVLTILGILITIFLLNPLWVGCCRFFYKNLYEKASLEELFYGFKENYLNVVKIMFFRFLYIFLWSLLFVIPGIVKSYQYRMIPYLLAEDAHMSKEEAFDTTKMLMDGNKLEAFIFDLSFLGWAILSAITFYIVGVFVFAPYYYSSSAALYDAIQQQKDYRVSNGQAWS